MELGQDDPEAPPRSLEEVLPLMYKELRSLAARFLRYERAGHTLQPTALVHEVYLRMRRDRNLAIEDRHRFLAAASELMRRILVDHARRRLAFKRGGDLSRITLTEEIAISDDGAVDVLALERALEKLAALEPEAARIVSLRFYGGLTEVEIAHECGRSERWVRDHWRHARAWMLRELSG